MRNTVELLGHYGGDETHARSAWTSTDPVLTPEKVERIPALLRMLAREGHHTPFEASLIHFSVICDTASHIHLLKHRIGVSINGESARYKELREDKFLVPDDWPDLIKEELEHYAEELYRAYHYYLPILEKHLGRKRAKESARFFLPFANQIQLDVKMNFRAFMHFVGLRYKDDAQREIRNISGDMLQLVHGTGSFDASLDAFGYSGDSLGSSYSRIRSLQEQDDRDR